MTLEYSKLRIGILEKLLDALSKTLHTQATRMRELAELVESCRKSKEEQDGKQR